MLKRILLVLFALAQIMAFSPAWGADRTTQVKELMRDLDFDAELKEMRAQSLKTVDLEMDQMMAQIKKNRPNLDDATIKELKTAMKAFMRRVVNSWDPAEAERIYTSVLVKDLPEDNLKAALEYYKTPGGKRAHKAFREASQSMRAYIHNNMRNAMSGAIQDYVNQVRTIFAHHPPHRQTANTAHK